MRTLAFAHRGGPFSGGIRLPDNSLPAFRRSLEIGARGLESDAWRSADGWAVLTHDPVVRRGLRRRRVESHTATELAQWGVPRLADVYEQLGTDFDFSIDAKSPEVVDAVVDAAVGAGAASRLYLCSGSIAGLARVRDRDVGVQLVNSTRPQHIQGSMELHVSKLADERIGVLNMRWGDWTAGLVTLAHRFDVRTFAWDTQEVRTLRAALEIGIDGVYCDRVDRMLAVLGEFEEDDAGSV